MKRVPGKENQQMTADVIDVQTIRNRKDARAFGEDDRELATVAANEIEMAGVEWLWPGRFARGKLGLIAGLPDTGKGQIAAFIAAAVTAGIELPCKEGNAPQGNVIWLNAEDGVSDTVVPRLIAAGANLERIKFVNGIIGTDISFNLVSDLSLLRKLIERVGDVVLVIIDPISAYLGVGRVDGRSATDCARCSHAAHEDGRRA